MGSICVFPVIRKAMLTYFVLKVVKWHAQCRELRKWIITSLFFKANAYGCPAILSCHFVQGRKLCDFQAASSFRLELSPF